MYTTIQQYLSQYKNINVRTKIKVAVQKIKKKKWKKNITTEQQCVSQYRNINFNTKIKVSVQKNIFLKIWKKSVGTLYLIITMYLNINAYQSVPKQTLYTSLL